MQALGAAQLLRDRLATWAAASGGRVHAPPAASSAVGLPGGEGLAAIEELVREGLVKPPPRAAAKAVACYGGDASRLLDLCRGRLAFVRAADLCAAAAAVLVDRAVETVTVRNGMRPEADAAHSAGFRVRVEPPHFACRPGAAGCHCATAAGCACALVHAYARARACARACKMQATVRSLCDNTQMCNILCKGARIAGNSPKLYTSNIDIT